MLFVIAVQIWVRKFDCANIFSIYCFILVGDMKKLFILTILLFSLTRGFPQQTPEELKLRKQASFKELYKEIAANKKENCLCTPSEQVIFSFQTITGKTASLCTSKAVSEKQVFLFTDLELRKKRNLHFHLIPSTLFPVLLLAFIHEAEENKIWRW